MTNMFDRKPDKGRQKETIYSHSKLAAYKQCPLQYFYRYISKIPPGPPSIEAFTGILVHKALEQTFSKSLNKFPEQQGTFECFKEMWDTRYNENIKIVKSSLGPNYYRNLGLKCLSNLFKIERYYHTTEDTTLGTEMYMTYTTKAGNRLRGYIDRVVQNKEKLLIIDYKTGRRQPRQIDLDFDWQGAIYILMTQNRFPDFGIKNIHMVWYYLQAGISYTSQYLNQNLKEIEKQIDTLIAEINQTDGYKPNPSMLCSWCAYQDICQEIDR